MTGITDSFLKAIGAFRAVVTMLALAAGPAALAAEELVDELIAGSASSEAAPSPPAKPEAPEPPAGKTEETPKGPKAKPAHFVLQCLRCRIEWRAPGTLQYRATAAVALQVKAGTRVRILAKRPGQVPELKISNDTGTLRVFEGQQAMTVGPGIFRSNPSFRLAFDKRDLSASDPRTVKTTTSLRRLIGYFVGGNPGAERPKRGPKDEKSPGVKRIYPVYPPEVKVIEAVVLPVSVEFSWPVLEGQVEPHQVFLWRVGDVSYAPYSRAEGGKATAFIYEHGKYYWQVEDANGNYTSVPRVLIVRPPAPKTLATTLDGKVEQLAEIEVLSPGYHATIVDCFDGRLLPVTFEVRASDDRVKFFALKSMGREDLIKLKRASPGPADEVTVRIVGDVPVQDAGAYRILGFHDDREPRPLAISRDIHLDFKKACSRGALRKVLKETGGGDGVPPAEGQLLIGTGACGDDCKAANATEDGRH